MEAVGQERIRNQQARPRVAVIDIDEVDFPRSTLGVGTVRYAASVTDYLASYTWAETDIVVSSTLIGIPATMYAIAWGDEITDKGPRQAPVLISAVEQSSREIFHLEMDESDPFALPMQLLAAEVERSESELPLDGYKVNDSHPTQTVIRTFLRTAQASIAALLERQILLGDDKTTAPRLTLLLPGAADLAMWARSFCNVLHSKDAEVVPHPPRSALHATSFDTFRESQLRELTRSTEASLAKLQQTLEDQRSEQMSLAEEEDSDVRSVLLLDGDDLDAAVAALLRRLGAEVTEVDKTLKSGERKREDHVVSIGDSSIMSEVKGYTGGPRTNDLRQIKEQRAAFQEREGRSPDAVWWVFNDHRRLPFNKRPEPNSDIDMMSEMADIVAFSTIDLYRLWTDVEFGRVSQGEALELLVGLEPGLWTYNSTGSLE